MSFVYRKLNFDAWIKGLKLNKGLNFRSYMYIYPITDLSISLTPCAGTAIQCVCVCA